MRWLIKCPAPTDSRQRKWGDFHFARALRKQLERLGHDVSVQYQPEWDEGDDAVDVVLLLRGKFRYAPRNRDALHVAWHLSHPEDVADAEIRAYDLWAVASESHARALAQAHGTERVIALLQCTDTDEFHPSMGRSPRDRRDVVFVGNSRDVERWCVLEHLREGYPLRIWGRGWQRWPQAQQCVVADYLENEVLGRTYGAARATLNDHWPDMRAHGFINNRIYDALACGLPVISDAHPDLLRRFGDTLITYDAGRSLQQAMDRYVQDYPRVFDAVQREAERVVLNDSFRHRTAELVEHVEKLHARRVPDALPRMDADGAAVSPVAPPPVQASTETVRDDAAHGGPANAPGIAEQIERLKAVYPWPVLRRSFPPFYWCLEGGGKQLVKDVLVSRDIRLMLEIGVFFGGSVIQWLEAAPSVTVIGIDPWVGDFSDYLRKRQKNFPGLDVPRIAAQIASEDGMYASVISNLAPYRERVIPVRGGAPDKLFELHALGVQPQLCYIDSDKRGENLPLYRELFPETIICGDDWTWGADEGFPRQQSVRKFAARHGYRIHALDATWLLEPR